MIAQIKPDVLIIDDRPLLVTVVVNLVCAINPKISCMSANDLNCFKPNGTYIPKVILINETRLEEFESLRGSLDYPAGFSHTKLMLLGQDNGVKRSHAYPTIDLHTAGPDVVERITQVLRDADLVTDSRASQEHFNHGASNGSVFFGQGSRGLTPKQIQILELASLGLSSKEIATELDVTINTVRGHTQEIFARLNVRNIAHAVALYNKSLSLQNLRSERRSDSFESNA